MSEDELIRMEDLNFKMIGLDPNGRNLTGQEEQILDKYVTKQDFDYLVMTLDGIHNNITESLEEEDSKIQAPLYALMQWLVNAQWRYIDLHDHLRRGEHVAGGMESVALESDTLTISECGTDQCKPTEEE
jgi:hypothetical protein